MNDALYIAATGMKAQNTQLDAIANNVANVNTPNFKRSTVRFGDLVSAGLTATADAEAAVGAHASMAGVSIGGTHRSFAPGELRRTDDLMQVAVVGDGFLEVQLPDGGAAFTRGGRLEINAERLLASAGGHPLKQLIHVPEDARQVAIAEDGAVSARDASGREWNLGRIELAVFNAPAQLAPMGEGLYRATAAAGEALMTPAGESGSGRLKQGFVEGSNVSLVDEMVQLMVAQRAYEMNVKVVQAADEIAGMTNNLRK